LLPDFNQSGGFFWSWRKDFSKFFQETFYIPKLLYTNLYRAMIYKESTSCTLSPYNVRRCSFFPFLMLSYSHAPSGGRWLVKFGRSQNEQTDVSNLFEGVTGLCNIFGGPTMDQIYLTMEETARFLHLSKSCLYKKTSTGTIPHFKLGKVILFDRSELQGWVEKHRAGEVV